MSSKKTIPCSVCRSWKKDQKKFSCDPNKCEILSKWLLNAENEIVFEVKQRQCQYVV